MNAGGIVSLMAIMRLRDEIFLRIEKGRMRKAWSSMVLLSLVLTTSGFLK